MNEFKRGEWGNFEICRRWRSVHENLWLPKHARTPLLYTHTFSFVGPPPAISVAVSRMLSQDTALFRIQWNMKQLKVGHYMSGERFHVYMLSLCHKVSKQVPNSHPVFLTVVYIMHCMYLLRFNFTWVNFQITGDCLFNQNCCCSRWLVYVPLTILVTKPTVPQNFNHFRCWYLWTLFCKRYCYFNEWNSRFISLFEFPISGNCTGRYRILMFRTHLIIRFTTA